MQVATFPNGISQTFDQLVQWVGGFHRSFYGLSKMSSDSMIYRAAAELLPGDTVPENMEQHVIVKGDYIVGVINQWRRHLSEIPKTFHAFGELPDLDPDHPFVEWYHNEDEMWCMVRLKSLRTS